VDLGIVDLGIEMGTIEIIATLLGIVSVGLLVRQNIWCWPTGIVMVSLYILIFYDARLYSDMGLQVAYVVMQIYGWYHWVFGGEERNALPVSRVAGSAAAIWLGVMLGGTAGLGWLMDSYTDADLAYWDAATTVMSLVAQLLQALKVLECWLLWIAVDVLAVGIYAYKGLVPTTFLYTVFLGLASWGYIEWRRSWRTLSGDDQEKLRTISA
jgi:nicotinamide mononucleotide transporter